MAETKTKTVDLSIAHTFKGQTYGPGKGVKVPEGLKVRNPADRERAYSWSRSGAGASPEPPSAEEQQATPTALPDDFPRRADLLAGGLTSAEAVRAASDEDLVKLRGVAKEHVPAIREAEAKLLSAKE